MRQRLDNADMFGASIWTKLKMKVLGMIMTGNLVLDADSPPLLNLDLNGLARNLTLPTEEEGLIFLVNNISATAIDLTVKNPAAATIGTLSQAEAGIIFCAQGVWYFRLFGTTT